MPGCAPQRARPAPETALPRSARAAGLPRCPALLPVPPSPWFLRPPRPAGCRGPGAAAAELSLGLPGSAARRRLVRDSPDAESWAVGLPAGLADKEPQTCSHPGLGQGWALAFSHGTLLSPIPNGQGLAVPASSGGHWATCGSRSGCGGMGESQSLVFF